MIIDITTHHTTYVQQAGLVHEPVNRGLEAGKITLSTEEERILRNLKRERERVQPVYNGKIINYNERRNNSREKREKPTALYNEWGKVKEFSENAEEVDITT
ncbi:hypothetical protein A3K82_03790 [Candidatus Pacearchaeota archaeon RBG_19FT_COMBO_34_9]|nr:MAG: hypothetical protein A3K82_03790 [Candidatus Pacearchaeota archaeon RBG_19FT_COMBO_34_9]OGJ16123.1 MAG: hypothetical protein A3K74_02735 [Candidatus Pacearchaeota archaeon RBG_13_33_26]